ncbi:hypothetical protein [Luteimonas aquatica]|uniref:hypothetical protein n=1 Tax=Luteimonas aquatica TaxID=450364 RepID=UPI001F58BC54|nr:hypothetical protein [Luteimonas aquatica]
MATLHRTLAYVIAAGALAPTANAALAEDGGPIISDGHGFKKTEGLGAPAPVAPNVSIDPTWFVYKFDREGIEYLQVNDRAGNVRLVLGAIDNIVWTLPLGDQANQVSTSLQQQAIPADAKRSVVYHSAEFDLVAYTGANGVVVWAVETSTP